MHLLVMSSEFLAGGTVLCVGTLSLWQDLVLPGSFDGPLIQDEKEIETECDSSHWQTD